MFQHKRRLVGTGWTILLLACAEAYGAEPETPDLGRAPEIDAKCWFNAQPVWIHQPPRLILLEFWSVRSRESRELSEDMDGFRRIFNDGRLLVAALTADDCESAEQFIRQKKIGYKIGAESKSADRYKVEKLPTILLIDPNDQRILQRWSGEKIKPEDIGRAIQKVLGTPTWAASTASLSPDQRTEMLDRFSASDGSLESLTEQVLAGEGEIGPEALAAFDGYYQANMPENTAAEDVATRSANYARGALFDDERMGYRKLLDSGRLSESAQNALRNRALDIARNDPDDGVRIGTIRALRTGIGRPGDPALLDALRKMRAAIAGGEDRTNSAPVRASLDHAIEELDPATRGAKAAKDAARPPANQLRAKLKESPDPAATPWAAAHTYIKSVAQKSTEQLLADYWAFPDPVDDEIGRQNATLKRNAALDEVDNRIGRGEISDLRSVRDHFARALAQEPDESIRRMSVGALNNIAKRGGRGLRNEVTELFERRIKEGDPDRYVQAIMEAYLKELKGG